jgi:hypothetical protein
LRDPAIERAVLAGEQTFDRIGCAAVHPEAAARQAGLDLLEPNPFNPPGNLRMGETKDFKVDLSNPAAPGAVRPTRRARSGSTRIPTSSCTTSASPARNRLDRPSQRSAKLMDATAASRPSGLGRGERARSSITACSDARQSVLAHAGEASESRRAFEALPAAGVMR